MKNRVDRADSERRALRKIRSGSGYTSARLSLKTVELLERLKELGCLSGLDEVCYELAVAELDRRGGDPRQIDAFAAATEPTVRIAS